MIGRPTIGCVRVLETVPIRYPMVIERRWGGHADSLWQRRSSLLAFKKAAK